MENSFPRIFQKRVSFRSLFYGRETAQIMGKYRRVMIGRAWEEGLFLYILLKGEPQWCRNDGTDASPLLLSHPEDRSNIFSIVKFCRHTHSRWATTRHFQGENSSILAQTYLFSENGHKYGLRLLEKNESHWSHHSMLPFTILRHLTLTELVCNFVMTYFIVLQFIKNM